MAGRCITNNKDRKPAASDYSSKSNCKSSDKSNSKSVSKVKSAQSSGFCACAASCAESLWLSVRYLDKERLRLARRRRYTVFALTESQRLSARDGTAA